MTRNQKLMRRVNILLENKNNKFKRKYFLLSTLAKTNIKNNRHLYSEAECYANVLIESNGEKPSEEYLIKLNEEALRYSGRKNINKEIKFIKNYNDMLNAKSSLLKESIIDQELSSISNSNYRLNVKLLETLLESIQKKKMILMESDDKETDANNFEELEKIISDQEKAFEDLDEEDFEEEDLYRDFSDEEIKGMQAFKSNPRNISLAKLGYKKDEYVPGQPRLTPLDKVGMEAIKKLKGSNVALRKFDIIRQIHFYLNVQQKLNLAKIGGQGKADLTQSKEKFSFRPSGLTEDEVKELRKKLDDMLLRHKNYENLNLEDDTITEGELLQLLFKAAGDRSADAREYLAYLNRSMPLTGKPQEDELEYDPDFTKDMSSLDQQQYSDDQQAKIDAGIDPETGQPLYEPDVDKVAQMSADQAASRAASSQLPDPEEMSAEDAFRRLSGDFGSYDKIKQVLGDISPDIAKMVDSPEFSLFDLEEELEKIKDTIEQDQLEELESLFDAINSNTTINIKILPPKSKAEIRNELYDTAATPEDFAYFVNKFIDTDQPMTLRDLGALMSRGKEGVASDANAVRQALTKNWFRSMFYSFDDTQKASVYATLADLFFKNVETLDLFKDDVIKIAGERDLSGSGAANYFDFVKQTMTKESNIRKFLKDEFEQSSDGDSYSKEDQANDIIDVMLTGNTAFRIFATTLMKDYYNNNVWNKCESELTYAIKEYFEKHYPTAGIAKDLPAKPSGKDAKTGKKQKMYKSRDVKKEQGKDIFNPIIYATMGRTGIKDSKGTLVNPAEMIDKRKQEFRKGKTLKKIQDFSANFKVIPSKHGTGPFDARDLEDLIDDMFSPKGIIGRAFLDFQKMSSSEFVNFIKWVDSLKEADVMKSIAQAYTLSTASAALDPDEFMDPAKIDAYSKDSVGRLKEYLKTYKDQIDQQRKNLNIEDAEFVSYQGKKCEVDDVDMSSKIIHIYLPDDTLVKVPFDQVSLIK
tara:strand:- start:43208 stop:46150 length:2943 start_codon:yes stop_codon:yes gene_type:complete